VPGCKLFNLSSLASYKFGLRGRFSDPKTKWSYEFSAVFNDPVSQCVILSEYYLFDCNKSFYLLIIIR